MHLRRKKGNQGELLAKNYLKKNGYKILHAPWYALPLGEIDIIARDDEELVFVEVKARGSNECGYPEEAVNYTKLKKLKSLVDLYLQEKRIVGSSYRLDVIAVEFEFDPPKITHIKCVG